MPQNSLFSQDGLENVASGLGTPRDKASYTRYGVPLTRSQKELDNMYRTSWAAKRIVDTVADDMTRDWRTFISDGTKEDSCNRILKLERLERRLGVRQVFNDALRWSRLYGGSLVFLGIQGQDPSKPLDLESIKIGDLRYLHVLDRWRVYPSQNLMRDTTSLFFGSPEFYTLSDNGMVIHASRVLRFNGARLPHDLWVANGYWDDSVLQHTYEALMSYDTVCASLSTMLFEANVDVIQAQGLSEILASKDGESRVIKRFATAAQMKSFNHLLLLDGSETYEKKGNNFSGLDRVMEQFMQNLCGASNIPTSRLFGRAPSGLNATGEGDIRNYYDMILATQEREVRPKLTYLDSVFMRSLFGEEAEDISFSFQPLWQISSKEKADIENVKAKTNILYLQNGILSKEDLSRLI